MRVLIDECLPRDLKQLLVGCQSETVQAKGWSGRKNGELLTLAQHEFDVFLTIDQGIEYQQNVERLPIAVVVIEARSNKIEALSPLIPQILLALRTLSPGHLMKVTAGNSR